MTRRATRADLGVAMLQRRTGCAIPKRRRFTLHRWRLAMAMGLAGVTFLSLLGLPRAVSAHPLGYFTVNQYVRLEVMAEDLRVIFVLDLAEIPAFQEIEERIDADGDGDITDSERAGYLDAKLAEIQDGLRLTASGNDVTLEPADADLSFPDGQANLRLVHLRVAFRPAQPVALGSEPLTLALANTYAADKLGWREMLVTHGPDVAIEGVEVPASDVSDELRSYPSDKLQSPLDERELALTARHQPGAAAAVSFAGFAGDEADQVGQSGRARWGIEGVGSRFASLMSDTRLSAGGLVVALMLATLWGAAHALSPGHGKTVVSAYLVGARGTPKHAAFLGLTVTVTHTTGVLALGLITLFASHFVMPQDLLPWLGITSGTLVVLIGLATLRMRIPTRHSHHDHDHTHGAGHVHDHDNSHRHDAVVHAHGGGSHTHIPPGGDGSPITWRSLIALGVSGGLLPCPSALVVLLGAIALGRAGFGLALVTAFSLGLATTLTLLGLASLYASHLLQRRVPMTGRIGQSVRYAPAIGSIAVALAGLAIIARALGEIGLR